MKKITSRIVVLGSSGVGKTSIIHQWIHSQFFEGYEATVENVCRHHIELNQEEKIEIDIIDTAGSEQFAPLRELYIQNGDGFVLVYSATSLSSFHEIVDIKDQIDTLTKAHGQVIINMIFNLGILILL